MALRDELLVLETATFEVEDITDVGQDAAGWCSTSCSCSSSSSCSTSSCCSTSTSTGCGGG
jgi:hypothetical protein